LKKFFVSILTALKRVILIGAVLWTVSVVWKFQVLRARAQALSQASAGLIEFRLNSLEESMGRVSKIFEAADAASRRGTGPLPRPIEALRAFLEMGGCVEQAAWLAGNGKDSYAVAREGGLLKRRSAEGLVADPALREAHNKGQVVISGFEYLPDKIPVFHLSYPLDGREGGFLLARINLWEFLKLPTVQAQAMAGQAFDFEVRDREGRLLAHRTGSDSLSRLAARFLKVRSSAARMGFEVQLGPTREALVNLVRPGRLIWWCLGLSLAVVFLL